jgi:type VI secretion system lysozyme-like protein
MADKTIIERLQPSLLDRLTDMAPESLTESRDDRVIDLRRLRDIIRRDLSFLLNSPDGSQIIDPEVYPQAARSVLNYGVREVYGDFSTRERTLQIRASIRQAIEVFEPRGADRYLRVRTPAGAGRYLIHKGSVAIDGISLTVAETSGDAFAVWLIPHTVEVTNLAGKKPGDPVNLEFDLLGKYVEKLMAAQQG